MRTGKLISFIFILGGMVLQTSAQAQNVTTGNSHFVSGSIEPTRLIARVDETDIDVYFYKPQKPGKFPLLVLSHGSPRLPEGRINMGAGTLRRQAEAYVANGVAVAVPIRRGYGGHGEWAESYGGCKVADYYDAGLAGGRDINEVVAMLSKLPEIDASHIVLMGVSAGGWASVAAATHEGIIGVVSFAGGRGSKGPDDVCAEGNLIDAASKYSRMSHVPELWIYSENDHFFYPTLAHHMHDAFTAAGGNAIFITAPPYGEDGHRYIDNISSWKPEVDSFLKQIGFLL